jgi:hypothetical protein
MTKPESIENKFMTASHHSPLAGLVLFMVCLAIAGSVLAAAHYYAVDLPQQQSAPAPDNKSDLKRGCNICRANCIGETDYFNCMTECDLIC